MSPIEARDYGLIDHIIGGDDAVFKNKAAAVKAAAAAKLVGGCVSKNVLGSRVWACARNEPTVCVPLFRCVCFRVCV
jgi:hypothetical protein